jgi:hypothetical protein
MKFAHHLVAVACLSIASPAQAVDKKAALGADTAAVKAVVAATFKGAPAEWMRIRGSDRRRPRALRG